MAEHSKIEWTDATWNPVTGCSVVSPGCTNCYAMKLAGTRMKHHPSRAGLTKDTKAGPVWTGEVRFNEAWLDQPLRWTRPRLIFVCAHGDLFHENVPDDWIDRVFAVMSLAPQHTFQVLTKRADRMRAYLSDPDLNARISVALGDMLDGDWIWSAGKQYRAQIEHLITAFLGEGVDDSGDPVYRDDPMPLPNVWLGVSAERQEEADARIPELLATPAAVRFVSIEPMLGPVDLNNLTANMPGITSGAEQWSALSTEEAAFAANEGGVGSVIDWVICGGESGKGARPMHPDWARALRDQCATDGVPFHFKQWGEWAPNVGAVDHWAIDDNPEISRFEHREWESAQWSEPFHPMWDDFDHNYKQEQCVSRIGKKRAGRLLDGVEHNGMPRFAPVGAAPGAAHQAETGVPGEAQRAETGGASCVV